MAAVMVDSIHQEELAPLTNSEDPRFRILLIDNGLEIGQDREALAAAEEDPAGRPDAFDERRNPQPRRDRGSA